MFVVIGAGELLVGVEGDVYVRDVRIEFFPVLVGDALIVVKVESEELVSFG